MLYNTMESIRNDVDTKIEIKEEPYYLEETASAEIILKSEDSWPSDTSLMTEEVSFSSVFVKENGDLCEVYNTNQEMDTNRKIKEEPVNMDAASAEIHPEELGTDSEDSTEKSMQQSRKSCMKRTMTLAEKTDRLTAGDDAHTVTTESGASFEVAEKSSREFEAVTLSSRKDVINDVPEKIPTPAKDNVTVLPLAKKQILEKGIKDRLSRVSQKRMPRFRIRLEEQLYLTHLAKQKMEDFEAEDRWKQNIFEAKERHKEQLHQFHLCVLKNK